MMKQKNDTYRQKLRMLFLAYGESKAAAAGQNTSGDARIIKHEFEAVLQEALADKKGKQNGSQGK